MNNYTHKHVYNIIVIFFLAKMGQYYFFYNYTKNEKSQSLDGNEVSKMEMNDLRENYLLFLDIIKTNKWCKTDDIRAIGDYGAIIKWSDFKTRRLSI